MSKKIIVVGGGAAGMLAAYFAAAAGNMGQQLKRPLRRSIITDVQRQIRRQNPHQRHVRKIMPFHDHLGADQDIRLLIGKC